jgi:hypothetical protein
MLAACYYFGLKIIRSGAPMPANPKGHGAIVAMEPHDILPYAIFAFAKDDLFPEFPPGVGLMTSAVFSLPWVRQIYSYCLAGSIDKKNFVRNLKEGNLCVMIPGGVQEVALQQKQPPGSIALYLNKRKGFVKLALQHGSTIIPSFTFNYDGSFRTWIPEDTLGLNKKLGFLPMYARAARTMLDVPLTPSTQALLRPRRHPPRHPQPAQPHHCHSRGAHQRALDRGAHPGGHRPGAQAVRGRYGQDVRGQQGQGGLREAHARHSLAAKV